MHVRTSVDVHLDSCDRTQAVSFKTVISTAPSSTQKEESSTRSVVSSSVRTCAKWQERVSCSSFHASRVWPPRCCHSRTCRCLCFCSCHFECSRHSQGQPRTHATKRHTQTANARTRHESVFVVGNVTIVVYRCIRSRKISALYSKGSSVSDPKKKSLCELKP